VERLHVACRRGIVEPGIGEQALDPAVPGHAHPLHAVRVVGHEVAVHVGEAAAALFAAGEGARAGTVGVRPGKAPDRRAGLE
jgi:hypothetical protein